MRRLNFNFFVETIGVKVRLEVMRQCETSQFLVFFVKTIGGKLRLEAMRQYETSHFQFSVFLYWDNRRLSETFYVF